MLPPQLAQRIQRKLRRVGVAHARGELMRLVHQQRTAAAAFDQAVHRHQRIENVIVIADDDVREHRNFQRKLKRADTMALRDRGNRLAIQHRAGERYDLAKRKRQPVVKAPCIRAALRPAVVRALRADLVLGGNLRRQHIRAARHEQFHRLQGAASARRPRGEERRPGAFSFADRPQGRIQRRHRLADARGRLRKKALSVPQGDVYVRCEFPLSRAILAKRKRERRKRGVPPLAPGELSFLPGAGRRAERPEFLAELLRRALLFVLRKPLPARIDIEHTEHGAAKPFLCAEHVPVHRRLCPVRRDQRHILRAELDLLDHVQAVAADKDPVRAARDMQKKRFPLVIGGKRHLLPVILFQQRAVALPRAMGDRALLHAPCSGPGGRQVALVQRRLHDGAHAHAHGRAAHARSFLRRMPRSASASSAAPQSDAPCAASHIPGDSNHTRTSCPVPSGTP